MGILDSLMGPLGQSAGGTGSGGGSSTAILSEVVSMLQSPQGGGLGGLLQAFEQGGLGHLFQSWVGSGQNLPVSAEQIQSALGNSGVLARLAQATGMQPDEVARHLSTLLPQVVDHLTPNGQIHQGDLRGALSSLAQRFLHS